MKIKYNRFGKVTKIVFEKNESPILLGENFGRFEANNILKMRKRYKQKKITKHKVNNLINIDATSIYDIKKCEHFSFLLKY